MDEFPTDDKPDLLGLLGLKRPPLPEAVSLEVKLDVPLAVALASIETDIPQGEAQ